MTAPLLLAVAGVLAALALLLRPAPSLAVVLGTLLLVPGSLPTPGLPGFLTVHRVVVSAALAGVLWQEARGSGRGLRALPPVASRFAVALGVLAVVGVGLAQPTTSADAAARSWESLAFGLVTLVTVVLLARAAPPGAGVVPLVVAAGLAALVASVEHATGTSYARAWYAGVPELLGTEPAQVLARRAGQVRVRGAADFTLAYAWSAAAVLPLAVLLAFRARGWRRAAATIGAPVLLLSVYWTFSRAVVVPLLVAVAVMTVTLVRRRTAVLVGVAAAAAAVVALSGAGPFAAFTLDADRGSVDVRVERLPAVTALAAEHAWTGLGLSGLVPQGFPTTDTSYLLLYAEAGVIGLAALAAVLVAGCAGAGTALRAPTSPPRRLALALLLGTGLLVVGAFTFDAFTTPAVAELFWSLVALGVVAGERAGVVPRRVPPRAAAVVLLALVGLGFALRALAPSHVARTWQFETLDAGAAFRSSPDYVGVQLRTTACDVVEADVARVPGTSVTCAPLGPGPGQVLLRLQARDLPRLTSLAGREVALVRRLPTLEQVRLDPRSDLQPGTPTALRTAPVWLLVAGGLLLLPVVRRR